MTIRAFIFDFGNVICSFDPGTFFTRAMSYSSLSREELLTSLKQAHDMMREYETGLLTSDEFFTRICAACRLTVSKEDFIKAYTYIFEPIPSTYALIKELKPRYKLGLLTESNRQKYFHCSTR